MDTYLLDIFLVYWHKLEDSCEPDLVFSIHETSWWQIWLTSISKLVIVTSKENRACILQVSVDILQHNMFVEMFMYFPNEKFRLY